MKMSAQKLGDVATVTWGNTSITKAQYSDEGYVAYSASGPDGRLPHFEHDGDGIVLSAIGARCGKCFLASGRWIAIKNTITITPDDRLRADVRYLYYYLNRESIWPSRGGGQPFIGLGTARELHVPLPYADDPARSLREQKRIAAILDKADALRRKRQQASDETVSLSLSVFYSMFGNPAQNPKDWELVRLGDYTDLVTSGLTPTGGSTVYAKSGPYFIRSQNVRMNLLDLSDTACLPLDIHESMARTKVRMGDVLLNITGASIGRVAWVDSLDREANVNQHVCIIRLQQTEFCPEYVSFCLSTPYGQDTIDRLQSGASRQGLNHQQVRGLLIPKPAIDLQREFARRLCAIRSLHAAISSAAKQDATFFECLVQRAFKGDL